MNDPNIAGEPTEAQKRNHDAYMKRLREGVGTSADSQAATRETRGEALED